MAVETDNIIVGPGDLYLGINADPLATPLPDFTDETQTVKEAFEADNTNWRHLGATEGGVELAYEPTYGDVLIDQYKDAARLFLEQQSFNFSTNLMESTLKNLILAWGYDNSALVASADTSIGQTADGRFNLGVLGEDPCEYKIAVVSKAIGSQPGCAPGASVERVYVANRVVSVNGSTLGLRRTEATMFPVTFRMLPYDSAPAGQEYGHIFDRDRSTIPTT